MKAVVERLRFVAILAVIGFAVTAAATFGGSIAKSVKLIADLIDGQWSDELAVVRVLEVIDSYLLAVVQLIVSIGLYELFIGELSVPDWLRVSSLDDLKKPIIDVLIVFAAVKAIEGLVKADKPLDGLIIAGSYAVVMLSLTAFRAVKSVAKAPPVDHDPVRTELD